MMDDLSSSFLINDSFVSFSMDDRVAGEIIKRERDKVDREASLKMGETKVNLNKKKMQLFKFLKGKKF